MATRLVVYGDSNSTGFEGTLDAGMAAGSAWAASLPAEAFAAVGGWAVDGATTTAMADNASPAEADVLVIMGGTNDLAFGGTTGEVAANATIIADVVGAPNVVLAAIAPFDYLPAEALALNESLASFAAQQGWYFVDPWVDVRTPAGTWVAEYRTDGVHTSPAGYARAGAQIAAQLRSAGL